MSFILKIKPIYLFTLLLVFFVLQYFEPVLYGVYVLILTSWYYRIATIKKVVPTKNYVYYSFIISTIFAIVYVVLMFLIEKSIVVEVVKIIIICSLAVLVYSASVRYKGLLNGDVGEISFKDSFFEFILLIFWFIGIWSIQKQVNFLNQNESERHRRNSHAS
ncbi:MAG: hypothetical protein P8I82_02135 [Flavobacteriales bacterium]|nr:hypothetical protein [Flavobacteriales bacterium]